MATQGKSNFPPMVNSIIPSAVIGSAQSIQQLRVSEAECEELKQSLRYVEIQLAKSQEDKESLQDRIKKMDDEMKVQQENLAGQMRDNKANKQHISDLQKKIDGFSSNQGEVSNSTKCSNLFDCSLLRNPDSRLPVT